jgi:hypothetical protein
LRGQLILAVQLRQHCDLDGTGLSEYVIAVKKISSSGGQVFDGYAHHSIEFLVSLFHLRIQFLPHDFPFTANVAVRFQSGLRVIRASRDSSQ